jgi:urease accessory protein
MGEVEDQQALANFLRSGLLQAARGMIPFAVAAAECRSTESTGQHIAELDRRYDLFLSNPIANRASRAQGMGFLAAVSRALGGDAIISLNRHFRENRLAGHWPVAFGAACGSLGLHREQMARMLLFITLRGMVSAAVRLGIVGPMQAQSLQYDLHPYGEHLANQAVLWSVEDAAQTSPVIELLQGMHDRLYSRLFLS